MDWAKIIHDVMYEVTFMEWALVAGVVFLGGLLAWAQFAPDGFDMRNLVADAISGKLDRWAFIAIGGWVFVTWGFVKLMSDGKGDWWAMLIYGLMCMFPKVIEQVAGPIIQQKFGGATPAATTSSTTMVATTTTETAK